MSKTNFTTEQIQEVLKEFISTDYFEGARPRKEKKTTTTISCPLCDEKVVLNQKGNSCRISCPGHGIIEIMKGF